MLGLLLDAGALMLIVNMVAREEPPEFMQSLWTAFSMAIINILILIFAGAPLGLFGSIAAILIIDSLWVAYMLHLDVRTAGFVMGFFAAYRVGFSLLF